MDVTDWRQIPPPRREIFSTQDILGRTNHYLNVGMCSNLAGFALQVYQLPGEKKCRYHFYFQLNQKLKFRDTEGKVVNMIGLAMWMERENWRDGDLTVRLVIKERPFYTPYATFVFPIKDPYVPEEFPVTLLTLFNLLRGNTMDISDPDRSNLTKFKFWPLEFVPFANPEIRGSRDALTQWMIRWHYKGYVDWNCAIDMINPDIVLEADGLGDRVRNNEPFGSIIGVEYTNEGAYDKEDLLIVTKRSKKIRAGYWIIGFERVLHHNGETLPYETKPVKVTPNPPAKTDTGAKVTQPPDLLTGSPRPRPVNRKRTENRDPADLLTGSPRPINRKKTDTAAKATQPPDLLTGSPRPRPVKRENTKNRGPVDLLTGSPRPVNRKKTENRGAAESHSDSFGEYQLVTMCQQLGIQSQPQSEHNSDSSSNNSGDSSDYYPDDSNEHCNRE